MISEQTEPVQYTRRIYKLRSLPRNINKILLLYMPVANDTYGYTSIKYEILFYNTPNASTYYAQYCISQLRVR